ncbi:MAG TPA: hypothetical protein VGF59_26295 [Bryobacteraceae bacterium]|jgi:hypothetical protein
MSHLTEEQLVLHYYGEESDTLATEQHLEECGECRATFASLQRVLNVVDSLPVPERGAEYGAQVWQRIEERLPKRRRWFQLPELPAWRWAAAGAAFAGLLVAAFLAGRFYPQGQGPGRGGRTQLASANGVDPQAGDRVLLVAVGDYLERSQMVLIELSNSNPRKTRDISLEQERAADLVTEARLYRQTAADTGHPVMASVLDELERVLVDIAHSPSQMSPRQIEGLRQRLQADGILFKIRVLGSNVRNQEEPAANAARQKL